MENWRPRDCKVGMCCVNDRGTMLREVIAVEGGGATVHYIEYELKTGQPGVQSACAASVLKRWGSRLATEEEKGRCDKSAFIKKVCEEIKEDRERRWGFDTISPFKVVQVLEGRGTPEDVAALHVACENHSSLAEFVLEYKRTQRKAEEKP